MSIYDIQATRLQGEVETLDQYKGKVLLVVNTASKCGFTPQFTGLQQLYEKYKDQGFVVLGFPSNQFQQEHNEAQAIQQVCERDYGVTFPMFETVDVNGKNAHPLFKYVSSVAPGILGTESIKWNFTKFLIDREGQVIERFASKDTPEQIESRIQELL